jgi:hypothetical protein
MPLPCQFISWLLLSLEPSYHVLSIAIWIAVCFRGIVVEPGFIPNSGLEYWTPTALATLDNFSLSKP